MRTARLPKPPNRHGAESRVRTYRANKRQIYSLVPVHSGVLGGYPFDGGLTQHLEILTQCIYTHKGVFHRIKEKRPLSKKAILFFVVESYLKHNILLIYPCIILVFAYFVKW